MTRRKLQALLDARRVDYVVYGHSPTFGAQKTAALLHLHGREFAKTVVLRGNGRLLMVVLPAPAHVDLARIRLLTGSAEVELVSEGELSTLFPDAELGAMPPFGNLYGIPVLVDRQLAEQPRIVFNAGTHSEVIRMAFGDFFRLVQPTVVSIADDRSPASAAPSESTHVS